MNMNITQGTAYIGGSYFGDEGKYGACAVMSVNGKERKLFEVSALENSLNHGANIAEFRALALAMTEAKRIGLGHLVVKYCNTAIANYTERRDPSLETNVAEVPYIKDVMEMYCRYADDMKISLEKADVSASGDPQTRAARKAAKQAVKNSLEKTDKEKANIQKNFIQKVASKEHIKKIGSNINSVAVAHIDGSYYPEEGIYGAGCVINIDGTDHVFSEANVLITHKENGPNIAEFRAFALALKKAKKLHAGTLVVVHDFMEISNYAGCVSIPKKAAAIPQIKQALDLHREYSNEMIVSFTKVKAHAGNSGNERVDLLAKNAAKTLIESRRMQAAALIENRKVKDADVRARAQPQLPKIPAAPVMTRRRINFPERVRSKKITITGEKRSVLEVFSHKTRIRDPKRYVKMYDAFDDFNEYGYEFAM